MFMRVLLFTSLVEEILTSALTSLSSNMSKPIHLKQTQKFKSGHEDNKENKASPPDSWTAYLD